MRQSLTPNSWMSRFRRHYSERLLFSHQRYTRVINFRQGWRGYLWQGRFGSVPLDEAHLIAAMRAIENNPVKARLVPHAEAYPWSSAKAHVLGIPDPLLSPHPLHDIIKDWRAFLATAEEPATTARLEEQVRTGRPQGQPEFLNRLEAAIGRRVRKQSPGPRSVGSWN